MKRIAFLSILAVAVGGLTSCGDNTKVIQAKGSDTMIQLASAWAESFGKKYDNIKLSATGGGSGGGIAALQNNTTDIANSSRKIKDKEKEDIEKATGKKVVEHVVCFDALAVYTHPSNPVEQISVEELSQIWSEGGTIDQWEQVGGKGGKITLVGRNSSSGTYEYFREHICGKAADGKTMKEFRQGVSELVGSTEVIETVAKAPTALGYSGMGYKNSSVKWLKISKKKGEPGIEPGEEVARNKTYPIARELYIYTLGEPTGEVKTFLDWVKGPEGQAVVSQEGFVALTK